MMSGAVMSHAIQSGLLRSCSMQSSTTMARGTVSRQSSSAPMSIHSVAASPSAIMVPGRYHRWPSATMPKNAAVHRRSRLGVDMRRVKALPLRSKRYTQAIADTVAPTAYSINSRMISRVICSNISGAKIRCFIEISKFSGGNISKILRIIWIYALLLVILQTKMMDWTSTCQGDKYLTQ